MKHNYEKTHAVLSVILTHDQHGAIDIYIANNRAKINVRKDCQNNKKTTHITKSDVIKYLLDMAGIL